MALVARGGRLVDRNRFAGKRRLAAGGGLVGGLTVERAAANLQDSQQEGGR
jgi:hypothetical protein